MNFFQSTVGRKAAAVIADLSEALNKGNYGFLKTHINLEKAGPDIEKYYESFIAPQRAELVRWEPGLFPDEIIMDFDDGGYILEPILPAKIDGNIEDSSIRMMIEVH